MGPFVRSTKGNESLLVITDHFTKSPVLIPIRTAKAKKICDEFENKVILEHSAPDTIICDNGKQFVSKEFKKLAVNYGVKNIFYNCFYHPQNNPTERQNKTIGAAIRSYISDNHKKWDENIEKIQCAMRTATNMVTGYTPFFLDRGREFIAAGSDYKLYEMQIESDVDQNTAIKSKAKLLVELSEISSEICKRMMRSYAVNKRNYDSNKIKFEFKKGDTVYRKNFALSDSSKNFCAKLAPKYVKSTVVEKISDLVYNLMDENGKISKFHIKDIKNR